ncbi:MAG: hypothetical protein U0325_30535 [Polyangiales bacterium]
MTPSSPETADPFRNLVMLQQTVGVCAVVCPTVFAVVVLSLPELVPPSMDPSLTLGAFALVASSLGLDALVAQRVRTAHSVPRESDLGSRRIGVRVAEAVRVPAT